MLKIITPPSNHNTKRERDANMELFRIIAMFLVLVVHADFFSLGRPTNEEMTNSIVASYARLVFESLAIGCVDMFILLSGWFGIRPNFKGFTKFVFQCLFFSIGIYSVSIIFHQSQLTIKGIAECLCLLKWNWFIRAYILLYLLSPVLNAYLEKATKTQHRNLLLYFFIFQTVFSWFTGAAKFFEHGYSTMSFIGLYMLARYISIYKEDFQKIPQLAYLLVYLFTSILLAIVYYMSEMLGFSFISNLIYQYDNPLVIFASLSLLLYFSKLQLKSKVVTWVGASSFAVFLFHMNPHIFREYYIPAVQEMYNNYNGFSALFYIFIVLAITFIVSIVIDQLRIQSWNFICYVRNCRYK